MSWCDARRLVRRIDRLDWVIGMIKDCERVCARVKSALRRRGRSSHDAEDLVQEAYLRLMRYESDHVVDKPEAFLMTTALHLSIDDHRRGAHRGQSVLIEDVAIIDDAPSTEDLLSSRERLARLSQCLGCLSEKTRTIFITHRVDGMTYESIGRLHGLSISGVERHIAKAVLQLAAGMAGWDA